MLPPTRTDFLLGPRKTGDRRDARREAQEARENSLLRPKLSSTNRFRRRSMWTNAGRSAAVNAGSAFYLSTSAFTDHIDETTKLIGRGTVARKKAEWVALLTTAVQSTMKSHLDAEMAKCQLMYENCHYTQDMGIR